MLKLFKGGNRSKYRTGAESFIPFKLSLILPNRLLLPGSLININLDGAAISFPAESCPDFDPGERVKLQMVTVESQKEMVIDATLRNLRTAEDRKLCRFQFIASNRLAKELNPSLLKYFNRRRALRVKPDMAAPIAVDLECGSGFSQGWIVDISTTGLGLGMKPEVAKMMDRPKRVPVSFQLPGSEKPLFFEGTVPNIRRGGNIVVYGIEFDQSRTEDFHQQQESITSYVMHRQKVIVKLHESTTDG